MRGTSRIVTFFAIAACVAVVTGCLECEDEDGDGFCAGGESDPDLDCDDTKEDRRLAECFQVVLKCRPGRTNVEQLLLYFGGDFARSKRLQSWIAEADLIMSVSIASVRRDQRQEARLGWNFELDRDGIVASKTFMFQKLSIQKNSKLGAWFNSSTTVSHDGRESQHHGGAVSWPDRSADGLNIERDSCIRMQTDHGMPVFVEVRFAKHRRKLAGNWSVADHVPCIATVGWQAGCKQIR